MCLLRLLPFLLPTANRLPVLARLDCMTLATSDHPPRVRRSGCRPRIITRASSLRSRPASHWSPVAVSCLSFVPLLFSFRPFCSGQQQPRYECGRGTCCPKAMSKCDSPTRNQLLAGTAWPQWFLALSTLRPLATARPFGLSCSSVSLLVKTVGTDREPTVSPGDASANSSSMPPGPHLEIGCGSSG